MIEDMASSGDARASVGIPEAQVQLLKDNEDLYAVLGVSSDATEEEVQKAHRKISLKCHPDKTGGMTIEQRAAAQNRYDRATIARQILRDPQRRAAWDKQGWVGVMRC